MSGIPATPAGTEIRLPDAQTVWTADKDRLTAESPVTLSWDNGQGFAFQRRFAIDNRYMVTVTQRVLRTAPGETFIEAYRRVGATPFKEALYGRR